VPAKTRKTAATGPSVVRLVEATGESDRSWDAAVIAALKAAKVKEPLGVEVGRLWAEVDGARLRRYHAQVKVAYRQSQRPPGRRAH
jgi:flavin-binding protein dodecin